MGDCGFEELEHTADWALKVWGTDAASLFRCAAQGMLELLGAEPAGELQGSTEIKLQADDLESLLVSWLDEILFRIEGRHMTFAEIEVEITAGPGIHSEMKECPSAPIRKQIKAVTYHELAIEPARSGFETTIVFDV